MRKRWKEDLKLYDPITGRKYRIGRLIERLGILAVAKKYHITESAVRKWLRGDRRPAKRTISQSTKELF